MRRSDEVPRSRKEQRERTESTILAAARNTFAEHGFERATIRGIAREADVDPALVMQYFGNKDALFAAAARSTVGTDDLVTAGLEELPRMALAHVFAGFEDPVRRVSSVALLRSCLTHPGAQAIVRDEVMRAAQASVARTIGGEDAALRAAVLNACTLGLSMARYLLEDPVLARASRDEIERVMEPGLRAIVARGSAG
jgi:AcrR family transcriptional regulator